MNVNFEKVDVENHFLKLFGESSEPFQYYFCPGRVNLIGEHIDYNGGLVLPASLTLGITAIVRPNKRNQIRIYSSNKGNLTTIHLKLPIEYNTEDDWGNYPKGIIAHILKSNISLQGFDALYTSNLPDGSGLSSSAAIEVLTYYISLNNSINKNTIDLVKIALDSQSVENNFIGVNCGIMDQFAVAMGRKSHAILLNCESLEYKYIPVDLKDFMLVIMNTNKKRELAESKYNERRSECERSLAILNTKYNLPNLCSATLSQIEEMLTDEPILLKRARHVVTENLRVRKASTLLSEGNLSEFGKLLIESHVSLRDDYEVTGKELDVVVEEALKIKGCIGARMTGAGFGGCAIALVEKSIIASFCDQVGQSYKARTDKEASFYVSEIGNGVCKIF
ncbi:MAG: galactokinase [Cytophagaceae bacterium]|nr:galactokinase [Cytophagaceae bacterium]MDW8456353.1 galactokinase [Cytophagaceae bacterium]